MNSEDEELIAACIRGETAALDELVRRYRDPLLGFIFSMVRDYQAAEEVFQDTWLRVYAKAGKFKPGKKFRTWLYAIAANRSRDELRKMARRKVLWLDSPLGRGEEDGDATHGEMLESPLPGPADVAAAREFGAVLDRELAGLTRAHREVVVLSRLNGLTYREIARVLGVPAGTVRSRLHYALEHLRRNLGGWGGEKNEKGASGG